MRKAVLVEVQDHGVGLSLGAGGSDLVAVSGEHSMASMRVIAALRQEIERMRSPEGGPACATCKWAVGVGFLECRRDGWCPCFGQEVEPTFGCTKWEGRE